MFKGQHTVDILQLQKDGTDTYVGKSPRYTWGRIYGGLVIAQALRAAMHSVDTNHYTLHSLHAYFILSGNLEEPVRYEVDRLRTGRTFNTRQVVARQNGGAILNLSASFHRHEDGPDASSAVFPSDVRPPEEGKPPKWGVVGLDARIELRSTDTAPHRVWARYTGCLTDTAPDDHFAALAYMSDVITHDAVVTAHPVQYDEWDWDEAYISASLDHAMWFHRAAPADEWVLFVLRPHQFIGTRGLAFGDVFTRKGDLVATVAQQGLVRVRT